MPRARIGCSGWNYADWRVAFYPQGLPANCWLEHYATVFDTVEVNATFYRLPSKPGVARWAKQTPEDFEFAVKGSRDLTHMKRLRDVGPGIERFYDRVEPLIEAGKLGPVLWQLPETFKRDDDVLGDWLNRLPPGRHCFEFRDKSWFVPEIAEMLQHFDAAFVQGHDARRPLPESPVTADWSFLRFHSGERGRAGNYSAAELELAAARVQAAVKQGDVYVYVNNDWEAFAARNAQVVQRLVRNAVGVAAAR